jgi:chemotaxis protein histidine kinase CheA/CheY-like chemotaxis protein
MSRVDEARQELLEDFRKSTLERTEKINLAWISLETDPDNQEMADELQRLLHSLKGESKMMGFADVSLITHRTEDLVIAARDKNFQVSDEFGDAILAAVDMISSLVLKRAGTNQPTGDVSGLLDRLDLAIAELGVSRQELIAKEPLLHSNIIESEEPPTLVSENFIRVDLDHISSFTEAVHEALVKHAQYEHSSSLLMQLDIELQEKIAKIQAQQLSQSLSRESQDIHQRTDNVISLQILDTLYDMQHRLSTVQQKLDQQLYDGGTHLRELNHKSLNLRLVPIGNLFNKYVRNVRSIARDHNKNAVAKIIDRGVTLDKNIADKLADSLLHIVRNSIDHGIESPDERKSAGKPQEAQITFAADTTKSGSVVVRISDDGRGIDTNKVKNRAIELGYISKEAAETLRDEDILNLLFIPGFSTSREINQYSGRGVGLDVVQRQAELLGGNAQIESSPNRGTVISVTVPSTALLSRVLVINLGRERYALPSIAVSSVFTYSNNDIEIVHNKRFLRFREKLIRLENLSALIKSQVNHLEGSRVVIIHHDRAYLALLVSDWYSDFEVVIKPLGALHKNVKVVSGACVLPKGELALVLNPSELISIAHSYTPVIPVIEESTPPQTPNPAGSHQYRILLVEDSAITCAMVARILRALDYLVTESRDGHDALSKLATYTFDLILTDLDMPNMNGFELIRKVREQSRWRTLPIIVLTTRGSDQDKRRAIDAGADGFLVKTDFSEEQLQQMITSRLG